MYQLTTKQNDSNNWLWMA